jgi:hypothetical protein
MSLNEILQELPKLTEEERQQLRVELDAYYPDQEREWAKIAAERLHGLQGGERNAIPADEVFAKARRLIQQ